MCALTGIVVFWLSLMKLPLFDPINKHGLCSNCLIPVFSLPWDFKLADLTLSHWHHKQRKKWNPLAFTVSVYVFLCEFWTLKQTLYLPAGCFLKRWFSLSSKPNLIKFIYSVEVLFYVTAVHIKAQIERQQVNPVSAARSSPQRPGWFKLGLLQPSAARLLIWLLE